MNNGGGDDDDNNNNNHPKFPYVKSATDFGIKLVIAIVVIGYLGRKK